MGEQHACVTSLGGHRSTKSVSSCRAVIGGRSEGTPWVASAVAEEPCLYLCWRVSCVCPAEALGGLGACVRACVCARAARFPQWQLIGAGRLLVLHLTPASGFRGSGGTQSFQAWAGACLVRDCGR
jgi:hypothetical protein